MKFFKGTDRIKDLLAKAKMSGNRSADQAMEAATDPAKKELDVKPQTNVFVHMKNQILLHKWMVIKSAARSDA
ncbi:hypothetical protein LJK88_50775 [Paenibacillus sp. P26]|nr:hypothetical protein LJK88_50775 [Paenibacillus sp. P26]UUZ91333.1 hypothetical protein LJK87_37595 [Paenibacillus sp. P25]